VLWGSLAGAGCLWGSWCFLNLNQESPAAFKTVAKQSIFQSDPADNLKFPTVSLNSIVLARPSAKLSPLDRNQLNRVLAFARQEKLSAQPMGARIQAITLQFLGSEYKAGLLDQTPTEQLTISLQQFDCVLLIEAVVALARTVVQPKPSSAYFVQQVEAQRYRNGQLHDYCSRLHYFSDWIADGERRGLVTNLTSPLGGVPLNKTLNFMSRHRSSYGQLKSDDEAFRCIQSVEAKLNTLPLTYIPTAQIRNIYPQLQAGDIVAIATAEPGLDVTHTGFAELRADGGIGFIHASPGGVVRRATDLQTYTSRVRDAIGIIVVRAMPSTRP
jgi:Protein of unknown function (DUF1460)